MRLSETTPEGHLIVTVDEASCYVHKDYKETVMTALDNLAAVSMQLANSYACGLIMGAAVEARACKVDSVDEKQGKLDI